MELKPIGGVAWARRRQPHRMRATYRRLKDTEQFLGFYDVHGDCLSGLFRTQKRLVELQEAFRQLRGCYPRRRLFVVMDNLHDTHDHPRFLALLRLRITPVWTPTEASWLNLIEARFGVLKRFTLVNTDDASHVLRRRRTYRYLRCRHRKLGVLGHPLTRIRSIRVIKLERHERWFAVRQIGPSPRSCGPPHSDPLLTLPERIGTRADGGTVRISRVVSGVRGGERSAGVIAQPWLA